MNTTVTYILNGKVHTINVDSDSSNRTVKRLEQSGAKILSVKDAAEEFEYDR